ncbi:uncharacterized protein LOC34619488, partial [Cyclospora cayetanensis]|uniref:Uncharacterized protein LOC34619488 n=1 Tax=Cyclospora cayetanensis TaxID=88456 RepID=A0A6P6RZJ9_9EIME
MPITVSRGRAGISTAETMYVSLVHEAVASAASLINAREAIGREGSLPAKNPELPAPKPAAARLSSSESHRLREDEACLAPSPELQGGEAAAPTGAGTGLESSRKPRSAKQRPLKQTLAQQPLQISQDTAENHQLPAVSAGGNPPVLLGEEGVAIRRIASEDAAATAASAAGAFSGCPPLASPHAIAPVELKDLPDVASAHPLPGNTPPVATHPAPRGSGGGETERSLLPLPTLSDSPRLCDIIETPPAEVLEAMGVKDILKASSGKFAFFGRTAAPTSAAQPRGDACTEAACSRSRVCTAKGSPSSPPGAALERHRAGASTRGIGSETDAVQLVAFAARQAVSEERAGGGADPEDTAFAASASAVRGVEAEGGAAAASPAFDGTVKRETFASSSSVGEEAAAADEERGGGTAATRATDPETSLPAETGNAEGSSRSGSSRKVRVKLRVRLKRRCNRREQMGAETRPNGVLGRVFCVGGTDSDADETLDEESQDGIGRDRGAAAATASGSDPLSAVCDVGVLATRVERVAAVAAAARGAAAATEIEAAAADCSSEALLKDRRQQQALLTPLSGDPRCPLVRDAQQQELIRQHTFDDTVPSRHPTAGALSIFTRGSSDSQHPRGVSGEIWTASSSKSEEELLAAGLMMMEDLSPEQAASITAELKAEASKRHQQQQVQISGAVRLAAPAAMHHPLRTDAETASASARSKTPQEHRPASPVLVEVRSGRLHGDASDEETACAAARPGEGKQLGKVAEQGRDAKLQQQEGEQQLEGESDEQKCERIEASIRFKAESDLNKRRAQMQALRADAERQLLSLQLLPPQVERLSTLPASFREAVFGVFVCLCLRHIEECDEEFRGEITEWVLGLLDALGSPQLLHLGAHIANCLRKPIAWREQLEKDGVRASDIVTLDPLIDKMTAFFAEKQEETDTLFRSVQSRLTANGASRSPSEEQDRDALPSSPQDREFAGISPTSPPLSMWTAEPPSYRVVFLRDLTTALVTSGTFDARIQMLLDRLAVELRINPLLLIRIQENLAADLLSILQANTKEGSKQKTWRRLKIAGAAVGGGVLLALTAGLAAPGIAAAVASLGSLPLSAFLASAGGMAALVSIFGAGGAGLTGWKYSRRIATVKVFEFLMLNGRSPSSLRVGIGISGYLRDDDDVTLPWVCSFPSPRCDLHALKWEPQVLKALGGMVVKMVSQDFAVSASKFYLQHTVLGGLTFALFWPIALMQYAAGLDNTWMLCRERAQQAGNILADAVSDKA